jgi:iron complex outermembrane receptor protein
MGTLTTGWHKKFRAPTLNDLYWPEAGNQNLSPEKGFTSDLQWKNRWAIQNNFSFQLELELYKSQIQNYIQWLPQGLIWRPENVGNVYIQGFHLRPELSFSTKKHAFRLGYGLNLSKSAFTENRFEGDNSKGKQLIYMPSFQSELEIRHSWLGLETRIWIQQTGIRNVDPSGETKLPGFTLVNGRVQFTPGKPMNHGIKVFAEGQNLLNTSYQWVAGYPLPGRQFTFGIEMNFY